jgi:hypothetical protein
MALEVWIAFGPEPTLAPSEPGPARLWGWLVRAALVATMLLPLGERWGYCDAWPAHALYASHVERTEVYLHESELGEYPREIQAHVKGDRQGPWCRLDLTAWSRTVRGVPIYPQGRVCNGVAEALAACYGERRAIRVVQWGRADRWTGARTRVALIGLEEIRRHGDTYLLNAHPARSPTPSVSRSQAERRGATVPRLSFSQ